MRVSFSSLQSAGVIGNDGPTDFIFHNMCIELSILLSGQSAHTKTLSETGSLFCSRLFAAGRPSDNPCRCCCVRRAISLLISLNIILKTNVKKLIVGLLFFIGCPIFIFSCITLSVLNYSFVVVYVVIKRRKKKRKNFFKKHNNAVVIIIIIMWMSLYLRLPRSLVAGILSPHQNQNFGRLLTTTRSLLYTFNILSLSRKF